jgi:mono/diheme cytochrome c family protein
MPPWKESLTADQRWQVIHYVQQIFAHPAERDPDEGDPSGQYTNLSNPLPPAVETLDEGKHIFIRECWVCHGDAGTGAGIYRQNLLPVPPDFSDGSYGDFTDSDYFWRISEGVPWTAMPVWKWRYTEAERWALVYYIRVNFTQTLPRPSTDQAQVYPAVYLAQDMPANISPNQAVEGDSPQLIYAAPNMGAGKMMFTQMCAHCHGLSGLGDGWDGAYLDVKPANFTSPDVQGLSAGEWLARVSYGLQNSAMPAWGEWMPVQNRWNVIAYVQNFITEGARGGAGNQVASVFNGGAVAVNFAQVSTDLWKEEGHTIDTQHGADLFKQYCASCHGSNGQGLQPDASGSFPGRLPYPAPFPADMPFNYIFWRVWEGVPDTRMGPFTTLLSETDIFDLSSYVQTRGGATGGGSAAPPPSATPAAAGSATPSPSATPTGGPTSSPTATPTPGG